MKARPRVNRLDRCPDFETLLDHWEGELEGEAASGIQAHLDAGCPRCGRKLEEIERVMGLLARSDQIHEPPEELYHEVLEAGRISIEEKGERELPVHVASLLSVTPGVLPAGYRGAEPSRGVKEYVHQTAPVGVRIQLKPDFGGKRRLRGSVYATAEAEPVLEAVVLRGEGGEEIDANLLPRGGFEASGIPEGSYTLLLRFDEYSVVFPGFRAGEPTDPD
jgi:hypothetical protein